MIYSEFSSYNQLEICVKVWNNANIFHLTNRNIRLAFISYNVLYDLIVFITFVFFFSFSQAKLFAFVYLWCICVQKLKIDTVSTEVARIFDWNVRRISNSGCRLVILYRKWTMSLPGNGIFVLRGEISTLMTAIKRGTRWNSSNYQVYIRICWFFLHNFRILCLIIINWQTILSIS